MELSNSACNGQKLLLVSSYLLHSHSSQWSHVYSTTVSCPKWYVWDLAGSCWLHEYHGQRLFEQVTHDAFSKTTTALRNAYPLGWKRVSMWTARMHLDHLQDPELTDTFTSAQLFSNCYFFTKDLRLLSLWLRLVFCDCPDILWLYHPRVLPLHTRRIVLVFFDSVEKLRFLRF